MSKRRLLVYALMIVVGVLVGQYAGDGGRDFHFTFKLITAMAAVSFGLSIGLAVQAQQDGRGTFHLKVIGLLATSFSVCFFRTMIATLGLKDTLPWIIGFLFAAFVCNVFCLGLLMAFGSTSQSVAKQ